MAAPVEVSIREGRKSPTVSIESVEDTQTFEDVFVTASRSQGIVELASHVQHLEGYVWSDPPNPGWVKVSRLDSNLLQVIKLYSCSKVLFKISLEEEPPDPSSAIRPDGLAALMTNARRAHQWASLPPSIPNPSNGKHRIYNRLLEYAKKNGCGFRGDVQGADMARVLNHVVDAFFKLTHFEPQLFDQHVPEACKAPASFRPFCGFSAVAEGTSHKTAPSLDQIRCEQTAAAISEITVAHTQLNNKVWKPLRDMLSDLKECLYARKNYLAAATERAQERRRSEFVKTLANGGELSHHCSLSLAEPLDSSYYGINNALGDVNYYVPVSLAPYLPSEGDWLSKKKSRWVEQLALRVDIYLIRWVPGGQKEAQYWAMKVDKDAEARGQPRNNQLIAAAIERCQQEATTYFSRQMQKTLRERAERMLPEKSERSGSTGAARRSGRRDQY